MKKYYLSLIIPAYNEEKKIERDVKEAFTHFKQKKITAEVIVSTDGITDNTNKIVQELQKEYPHLVLIAKEQKIGKGAAIKKGVEKAKGKYIMFADAGYCVPFKFISSGIKKLEEGYDLAFADRGDKKTIMRNNQPLYRKIGSRAFGILVKYILGVPRHIRDTQCGFKIYKRDVAKSLFGDLETDGMMFDLEHILRAKKSNFNIGVFPIEWKNDSDTKFDPISGGLDSIREIYNIKAVLRL
ncbi:glycosyltransferase [Candidatus Daviesbacteria bacterium]|nr:glycosyltransferase [Candidatus Daviesbacteria bacterium]